MVWFCPQFPKKESPGTIFLQRYLAMFSLLLLSHGIERWQCEDHSDIMFRASGNSLTSTLCTMVLSILIETWPGGAHSFWGRLLCRWWPMSCPYHCENTFDELKLGLSSWSDATAEILLIQDQKCDLHLCFWFLYSLGGYCFYCTHYVPFGQ